MTPQRTIRRSIVAATGLLAIAAPAFAVAPAIQTPEPPAPAPVVAAAVAPVGTGTAATTSLPLSVTVDGLTVALGSTVLSATNDPDVTSLAPWSGAAVTLANIGGARFGDLSVRSDGSTANNGASLDRTTLAGPVAATVGDLLATADKTANSAAAGLTTLTTGATVLEGLGLDVTVTDVVSSVDNTGASATHTLALADVTLNLGHVLGGALEQLSLDQLLELSDLLELTGVLELAGLLDDIDTADELAGALDDLIGSVAAADVAAAAVGDGVSALLAADALDPLADYGDLGAIVTLLSNLENLAPTDFAGLTALVLSPEFVATGCASPADLAEAITCVDAYLAPYTNAVATLQDLATTLNAAVADYLDAVAAADAAAGALNTLAAERPDALAGLLDEITALIGEIRGTELLSIGPVRVAQQVRAIGDDLDASSATTICEATTVAVLGGTPLGIEDCTAPGATIDTLEAIVEGTLGDVLSTVGGVDVGDGVELDIFGAIENTTSQTDDVVTASSSVEVLSLTVPEITVTPCDVNAVGDVACLLLPTLDDTLGDSLGEITGLLGTLQTTVTAALADVPLGELLTLLGQTVPGVAPANGVGPAVDAVVGTIGGIIAGVDLDRGLTTAAVRLPGARIVVDPQLEAQHSVVAAPATPASPADPAPTPSDDPTLPNTGGGAALFAVLALGAGAWLWRRKETGEA